MKRYTIYFLVLLVLLFVMASCATTEKVKPVNEKAVAETTQAVETPAESVKAEPVKTETAVKTAVAETTPAVEKPGEPVKAEPVVETAVVNDEPEPVEIWRALNLDLSQNGKPVYLPEEYLRYPVFIGIYENEYAELVVWGTDFKIAATYELTESGFVVTPVYYENVPDELKDIFLSLNVELPTEFYFTGNISEDGTAVLNAKALEYELSVAWMQVM